MISSQNLLAELVRRPSVNPMGRVDIPPDITYEHRVTEFLELQLRNLGVEYRRQKVAEGRENLLAFYRPNGAPTRLLWEAHQDTVPVDGMTIDPFAAEIRDGRMYGRGSCDVKAGVAVMLTAFSRLVRENPSGSAAVTVAFTVDEEHTFLGVQELMRTSKSEYDFAVVAEPTELNIVTTHKGVVRWRLFTEGRACHSSRPEQGVNAVYRMSQLVLAIEAYAEQLRSSRVDPRLGTPTLSVGRIAGGVSPNTVPDSCRIDIDRRLLPGESAVDAEADLIQFVKQRCAVPFIIERSLACPPLPVVPDDHPLLCRLGNMIDRVVGRHEKHAVPYGTDASTIALAGVPAVVFGPGDIAQAHTKDEWIELSQLDRAVEILFQFAAGIRDK